MKRLLTGYVVSFNRRHLRHGPLFQNRFKSIVCQEDVYLFVNTSWPEIEKVVKERIKGTADHTIPFVYDGEPGLDDFLSAWLRCNAVPGTLPGDCIMPSGKTD